MFHPYASIQGIFKDPMDGCHGPSNCIWSQEFYESDPSRGFLRGFTYEISRGQGPVSTALQGMNSGHIPWGEGHHQAFRKMIDRTTGMVAICEDLPEAHNTVTLDHALTDSNGIPAPKIDYTISKNSQAMLDFSIIKASEVLRAAGALDVIATAPISIGGWHLMGTARMGIDPDNSVVNEWGRSHDVKNLFIVDGSLFVTSAGVNPTRTIQALALYIADNIKKRLDTLFD
jgi:choline dehydrogenase-like flavoprotein